MNWKTSKINEKPSSGRKEGKYQHFSIEEKIEDKYVKTYETLQSTEKGANFRTFIPKKRLGYVKIVDILRKI